jgi:uncharacterized protein
MNTEDTKIKELLLSSKTVAIVGLSPKEDKPSNTVAKYLRDAGYKVIPVNPGYDEILGEKCYHTLSDINETVDIVDIFMRADIIMPIVKEAVKIKPVCIWLQLGIVNEEAKKTVENHGITFLMDICIKKEYERLFSTMIH